MYSDLFTAKSIKITKDLKEKLAMNIHTNSMKVDKEKSEGLLTEKEYLETDKLMESGKSPGTDGLPAEFYSLLERCVYFSYKVRYQKGNLAITQRRSIISKLYQKRWVLSDVADHDHTCFLKGRSITENICSSISGLLIFIDFEKAFDTIGKFIT